MPELLEVETYRRQAEAVVGRTIVAADAPDAWFVKGTVPEEVVATVTGRTVRAARRRGKLLVLDLDGPRPGPAEGADVAEEAEEAAGGEVVHLGLRFGMTGRLLVDGAAAIDRLEYSSGRDEPAWDRFALRFEDGSELRLRDPRRLGGVSLDPDEDALGVDALDVTADDLRAALGTSTAPLKARLLDQSRVAGIGNLLADEILWRVGLDPARPAGGLDDGEVAGLTATIADVLRDLGARGGSHTGDLRAAAALDGLCPRDGAPLHRRQVGGRTTWSCPRHQR
ncbi:MAG TPA: DNA-formamidopyrimidine glycosylase family protein [Acidimicrobiales bacterium]|nr:DNA-formamidopyrimidine glycosylase family protein [Acidimicrobiales bacterium]